MAVGADHASESYGGFLLGVLVAVQEEARPSTVDVGDKGAEAEVDVVVARWPAP